MGKLSAGELDRRIEVWRKTEVQDTAGDLVEESWNLISHRWANTRPAYGREIMGAQQLVRDADTVWALRSDTFSRSIAPETDRFLYKGIVYEIVSVNEEPDTRGEQLNFLTCSRPDKRGDRGQDLGSAQP